MSVIASSFTDRSLGEPIFAWSGADVPLPAAGLAGLVLKACHEHAERIAIEDASRCVPYRELERRSIGLAREIRRRKPGSGQLVACLLPRSVDQVIAMVGILLSGNIAVPLDPADPPEKLRKIAELAAFSLAIVGGTLAETSFAKSLDQIDILQDRDDDLETAEKFEILKAEAEDDVAFVFFTSGSTGFPKGVRVRQASTLNALQWRISLHGVEKEDRFFYKSPVGFDISLWEIFLPLIRGACLFVARPLGNVDSNYIAQTIETRRLSIVQFTGTMLRSTLPVLGPHAAATLRVICCGGESWNSELARRCLEALPWIVLLNIYGQTETSLGILARKPSSNCRYDLSLVEICQNTTVVMFGAESGVSGGELYVSGLGLSPGYLNNEQATLDAFAHLGRHGVRSYRTGDMFREHEGALEFLGRNDNQIKIAGARVELESIENISLNFPGVEKAVCCRDARKDDVVLFIVVDEQIFPGEKGLRKFLLGHLNAATVPRVIERVLHIPISSNGKVDRRQFLVDRRGPGSVRDL